MDTTQPQTGPVAIDAPELLKPTEVATILRLSRMSVYRLITAGTLDAVRVGPGKHIRVTRDALDRYLNDTA